MIGQLVQWLLSVGGLAYLVWNYGYRQGTIGSSIGKSVLKFKVVSDHRATNRLRSRWYASLPTLSTRSSACRVPFPLWDAKLANVGGQDHDDGVRADLIRDCTAHPTVRMSRRPHGHQGISGLATRAIHAGYRPIRDRGGERADLRQLSTLSPQGRRRRSAWRFRIRTHRQPHPGRIEASLAAVEEGAFARAFSSGWLRLTVPCGRCYGPETTSSFR